MKISKLNKLSSLPFFGKETLLTLSNDSNNTINKNITNWIKNSEILMLKKGIYTTRTFYEKFRNDIEYYECLSTILYNPSYLSSEYILSKYNILTDVTYGFTCVSLKNTTLIENKMGRYSYKNIKGELYTGFEERYFINLKYYIAKKSKALFDFLYYKSRSMSLNIEDRNLVEDFRLNLDTFSKEDFNELEEYSNKGNKKLKKIIFNVIKYAPINI